jgi:polyisoprenoid-binding protein YceI
MRQRLLASVFAVAVVCSFAAVSPAQAADEYTVDGVHSSVTFKASHLGLAWVHGRFDEFSGNFTIDEDPAKCAFSLSIKAETIDTNNVKRNEHLQAPDFFNVKQFPVLAFKSKEVKAIKDGYEVTGDLTMHGVTKSVSFKLTGGKKAEFPPKVQRTGFSTELTLKRSEYGMDKMLDAIGDEVGISISLEGTKK